MYWNLKMCRRNVGMFTVHQLKGNQMGGACGKGVGEHIQGFGLEKPK
jgi:hypothetical protein